LVFIPIVEPAAPFEGSVIVEVEVEEDAVAVAVAVEGEVVCVMAMAMVEIEVPLEEDAVLTSERVPFGGLMVVVRFPGQRGVGRGGEEVEISTVVDMVLGGEARDVGERGTGGGGR
jgi:hypothetical protein